MKILIVLRKLKGGIGRANTEIANALEKKGHKVDILSREDNMKIFSLISSIFPLRKKIKQFMKKENYDVIYTQDYSMAIPLLIPYPIFWKIHFCCYCGTKKWRHSGIFFQGHHTIVQKIIGRIMRKKLVSIGDGIHRKFPKSTKIYRGINLKMFKPLNKKRNSIGWIERDTEEITKKDLKNISQLVGLKLLIAKNIPKNKMNEFYNRCKVFISLPRNDGYNNSWNEAMAAGVPIIIGNWEGGGSVLPLNKISRKKNVIKEIVKLIKNPRKINYRKWLIENEFTWGEKTEELIKFFKKFEKNKFK